jgi:hypothetical protein
MIDPRLVCHYRRNCNKKDTKWGQFWQIDHVSLRKVLFTMIINCSLGATKIDISLHVAIDISPGSGGIFGG